jgi:hypothetical protein
MGELDTQCASAELAYTLLVLALSERDVHGVQGREQQRKIFLYIQAFLQHAAAVARMLWPTPAHGSNPEPDNGAAADVMITVRNERARALRDLLGADTAFLRDAGLFDYPQRFERDLDAWFIATASRPVVDMAIRPASAGDDRDSRVPIRLFDPISMTYRFLGQEFDLPAIAAVLGWIHRSVARWAAAQAGG